MVEAGGIGEGGRASAGEDIDGTMADCAENVRHGAENMQHGAGNVRPRYEMNKKNS